ncbi:hypothetical protein, partial [Streptococcus pneumoniae]|uniref:hypothetical protein n=1 Tax=Streptococcus pneumoniae TaxID=1313 RepID=UPI0016627E9A
EARACYSFTLDTNSLSFKRIAENKDKVREKLLPKWRGIAEPAKAFVAEIKDRRYAFYEMTKKKSQEARACYSFTLDTNSLSFKRIAENKDKVREKLLP